MLVYICFELAIVDKWHFFLVCPHYRKASSKSMSTSVFDKRHFFLISFFNLYDFLFKDVSKFCFVFLLKLRCEKSFSKSYSPSKYLIYCIISKSCICILSVSEIPSWLYALKHMETCVIIEWSKWSS